MSDQRTGSDQSMGLGRLLREPLVHFLLLGGLMFLLGWGTGSGAGPETNRIVVTPGHVEQMVTTFARTWQRPPTERELEGLIQDFIREEVFYREALALGLDRDDVIIRRRMRQKMEFLTADVAEASRPTDEQLATYLRGNAEAYAIPPRLDLEQVYFSPDRRGADEAATDARRLRERLASEPAATAGSAADPTRFGDSSLLPSRLRDVTPDEIARQFGQEFAADVAELEAGEWHGPIRSGYGLHVVRVTRRVEGRPAELAEVRPAVERDWMAERRRETEDAVFDRLLDNYTVVIETPEADDGDPTGSGDEATS